MSIMQILDIPVGEESFIKVEGVTCTKSAEAAMPCISFSTKKDYWIGISLYHLDEFIAKLQEFRELVVEDGREEYLVRPPQ